MKQSETYIVQDISDRSDKYAHLLIYGIMDPTAETIFYIGRTKNAWQRAYEHVHAALSGKGQNIAKEKKIREIIYRDDIVIFVILERYSKLGEWYFREDVLIAHTGGLTNIIRPPAP